MALVIEDGTPVPGANSYATVAQARDYASARGVTLSADDPTVEALLIEACDYLESLESRFKGSRTSPDSQDLAWPRTGVYLYGSKTMFAIDDIPALLIKAQCQLAMDAVDIDLLPTGSGKEVVKEKVDVIEVEYSKGQGSVALPELNAAMAILGPLLNGGGGMRLTTYRI